MTLINKISIHASAKAKVIPIILPHGSVCVTHHEVITDIKMPFSDPLRNPLLCRYNLGDSYSSSFIATKTAWTFCGQKRA
jgi:hypothetical protein